MRAERGRYGRLARQSTARVVAVIFMLAGSLVTWVTSPTPAEAASVLPPGFQEQVVFSGLSQPTNIEFAPDGRVFVAEKRGVIKVFDSVADSTPTTFADLTRNVHNAHDRGLLGLALHPQFPAEPWVYALYAYDAPPGQTAPVWHDDCSSVGGTNGGQCIVTARLSRLQASGNTMVGSEQVMIHDWCQQFASHSIGDLQFGADGFLYVSAGDGASFTAVDHGQLGSPLNPCKDPPGGGMGPPSADGGALRSQDVRTLSDPTGLDGTILRVDPTTGAAAPDNPLSGSSDAAARRVVATGLRNPYRFTMRPGTNEVWTGDVGWNTWEEVNRIVSPTSAVSNFGWPCYEGNNAGSGRQPAYDGADLNTCENLYAAGGVTKPYYAYPHSGQVVPGETCPTGSSSPSGAAFYPSSGGNYPSSYQGALFFADYSRRCIWAMLPDTPGGLPSPSNRLTFVADASLPVDLAIGPGGDLYYADVTGSVRRIRYFPANQPPVADISANPTSGGAPLTVAFDGTGSFDADPADEGKLRYEWDFTNDGVVDSTSATPTFTYTTAGSHTARLRVIDTLDASDTSTVAIQVGNNAPTAVIDAPASTVTWRVKDSIAFSGHATDPQQGNLPAESLDWKLQLNHCSSATDCHVHVLQQWDGVASGSFLAPDHEYPAHLELVLTATDAQGLKSTTTTRLDPKTVDLTFASNPGGLQLTVGSTTQAAPFARKVIQGSTNSISAPASQTVGGVNYVFGGWSDRLGRTHVITAPRTARTYTATFLRTTGRIPRTSMSVRYVDSEDTVSGRVRSKLLDGSSNKYWQTLFSGVDPDPPHPHEIQLDLGREYPVTGVYALPNHFTTEGRIASYEVYVSNDPANWGAPVKTGTFTGSTLEQAATFPAKAGRYVRLRALSSVAGDPWTTAAEIGVGFSSG